MDGHSAFDYLLDSLSESNPFQDHQGIKEPQGLPKGDHF
jgi:hypothetical protein